MAFIPTPNAAKVYYSWARSGDTPMGSTLWFTKTDFTLADMEALGDAVGAWQNAQIMPRISADYTSQDVVVYDMTDSEGPVVTRTIAATTGSQAGERTSEGLCWVQTFRTNARGRTGIGRNYLSGFTENQCNGNLINSSEGALNEVAFDSLTNYIPATGWTHVIVSFQLDGVKRTAGLARAVVTSEGRSNVLGYQRRRVNRP